MGLTGLRLPVFAIFLLISAGFMGVWSVWSGAGLGTSALRVVVTLVVLQLGYFAVLMAISFLPERKSTEPDRADAPGVTTPETNK